MVRDEPRFWAALTLMVLALLAGCDGDEPYVEPEPEGPEVVGMLGQATTIEVWQGTPVAMVENAKSATPFAMQRFLIDTGAPETILDLTNHPIGQGNVFTEVRAFGVVFPSIEVAAEEIFAFEAADPNRLDGIIGGRLLRNFVLTIDYRGSRAVLGRMPPAAEVLPGASDGIARRVPFELLGGDLARGGTQPATRIVIPVVVEGVATFAMVDTGATWMVLSESLLAAMPVEASRPSLEGITVALAGTSAPAKLFRIGAMKLGSGLAEETLELTGAAGLVTFGRDLPASIAAETGKEVKILIGGHMLREYLFTADYPARETIWTRYTSLPHVDTQEFVGLGVGLNRFSDGTWAVRVVYPGFDAEQMGVMVGDQLISIDGRMLTGLGVAEVLGILRGAPVGTALSIVMRRAGVDRTVSLKITDLLPPWP